MFFRRVLGPGLFFALLVICVPVQSQESGATSSDEASLKALLERADAAAQSGDASQAVLLYRQAIEKNPASPEARWQFGMALYDFNRFKEAEVQFQKLTELSPKAGLGYSLLGLCEFETNEYETSRRHLTQATQLGIADAEIEKVVQYHLALLAILRSEFEKATQILVSHFVTRNSVTAQVQTALGLALLERPLLPQDVNLQDRELLFSAGHAVAETALHRYAEAEQALSALIAERPKQPFLHLALARVFAAQARIPDALRQIDLEESISKPTTETRTLRAQLERAPGSPLLPEKAADSASASSADFESLARQAENAARSGHTDEALRDYREALTLNPDWREGLMAAGGIAYTAGDLKEASQFLRRLTELDPTDGTAFALLGMCDFQSGDIDAAFTHLSRGHDLGMQAGPKAIAVANYHLAILYGLRGEFEPGWPLLKQASGEESIRDQAKFAMGMNLLRLQMLPKDVPLADEPLVKQAGEAGSLLAISHYPEALKIFDQMIQQNPSRTGIHSAYGSALASMSHYQEAEAQFRAEATFSPQDAAPLVALANVGLKAQDLDVALQAATKAVELSPNSPRAREVLGRALLEKGQIPEAIKELERAVSLSVDFPEAHFTLARAYAKANRSADAERERQQFLATKH